MVTVQTVKTSHEGKICRKVPFAMPQVRLLGNVTRKARQGGSSKEYDSYSENRP